MTRILWRCCATLAAVAAWSWNGASASAAEQTALDFAPAGTVAAVAVQSGPILTHEVFGFFVNQGLQTLPPVQQMGFSVGRISRVTLFIMQASSRGPANMVLALETNRDVDWSKLLAALAPDGEPLQLGEYQGVSSPGSAAIVVGPRLLLTSNTPEALESAVKNASSGKETPAWAKPLGAIGPQVAAAVAVDHQIIAPLARAAIKEAVERRSEGELLFGAMFQPLWEEVTSTFSTLELTPHLKLTVKAECPSPAAAGRVKATVESLLVFGGNAAHNFRLPPSAEPAELDELQKAGLKLAADFCDRFTAQVEGTSATFSTEVEIDQKVLAESIAKSLTSTRDAARRMQSQNNVKQLLLSLHIYHDLHRKLPTSVMLGPDGKTPHSWRVAVLPYIEQQALYEQYKLNEPWDSPNNLKVLEMMPPVFKDPNNPTSTNTAHFLCAGPNGTFGGKSAPAFSKITDGLSNTIFIVDAKRSVPWTKPEDLSFEDGKPLPAIGGLLEGTVILGFGDGAVRSAKLKSLTEEMIRAIVSPSGGEVVTLPY